MYFWRRDVYGKKSGMSVYLADMASIICRLL